MMRWPVLFAALLGASCTDHEPKTLAGYVEAETLYMAPQEAGVIATLNVAEGDAVAAGDLLFRLDTAKAGFSVERAAAMQAAAAARAADAGALDQAVAEAEAELDRARKTYIRSKSLVGDGAVSQARLDADIAAFEMAAARVKKARAERDAARADYAAATADAALARQRAADLETRAPSAGVIERIYRRPGEMAAAGDPVVALLPPGNVKIRFYAPEPKLSSLTVGQTIRFACDGCGGASSARITFIAHEPEFTPPVIYSLDERAKLVFLVEARPDDPKGLRPGLPVDVSLP